MTTSHTSTHSTCMARPSPSARHQRLCHIKCFHLFRCNTAKTGCALWIRHFGKKTSRTVDQSYRISLSWTKANSWINRFGTCVWCRVILLHFHSSTLRHENMHSLCCVFLCQCSSTAAADNCDGHCCNSVMVTRIGREKRKGLLCF